MHRFPRQSPIPIAWLGGALLAGLLLWMLFAPLRAGEHLPGDARPADARAAADSKNFSYLGYFSGTNNYVGDAFNASGVHGYAYFDNGLQVLDISNPAAVRVLGAHETPKAGIKAIERDGGLLYVAVDRAIGLGGDYFELLSTDPITKPALLGTYKPPEVEGFPITGITDLALGDGAELYVAQTDGVTVLDRFSVDSDKKVRVFGSYATDVVHNLLATNKLLIADTNSGVELLTPGNAPSQLGKLETIGPGSDLAVIGDTLFRATNLGLEAIDISTPAAPILLKSYVNLQGIRHLEAVGALLYTTRGSTGGLRVYFAGDPLNLVETAHYQASNFAAWGLELWNRVYVTGGGLHILQYTGERPRLRAQATGNGVQVNGNPWGIGQTDAFTQPFTIRLAQAVASLDLQGQCEGVLRILLALQPISSEEFDPFEVFVEVLEISPTICEPERPQPVARSADGIASEARIDLRLDSGGLKLTQGDIPIFQNVRTPVAVASSRGQVGVTVRHDAARGATTVHALTGPVTVTPVKDSLAPVTLNAGQAVEVTGDAVGEIKQMGGLFLPVVVR